MNSLWRKKQAMSIRSVVCEWYGLHTMPLTIQTREEEMDAFETEHSYISRDLWVFVNHAARVVFRWSRDTDIDLVVWSGDYRMIQDVCFKDAYEDATAWNEAVLAIVRDPTQKVWVVSHEA